MLYKIIFFLLFLILKFIYNLIFGKAFGESMVFFVFKIDLLNRYICNDY